MSRKHKSERVVQPAAGHNPPPLPPSRPLGSVPESPIAKGVELHAQKLLHEAGSTSLAKTAVDTAAKRETIPDFREDQFAQRWGFRSRQEMLTHSSPVTAADGETWWATSIKDNRWIVWSQEDMSAAESFETLEEARQHVYGGPTASEAEAKADGQPRPRQTTRAQREAELNAWLNSESGLNKLLETYERECPHTGPQETGVSQGLMVAQILDTEFPPQTLSHGR